MVLATTQKCLWTGHLRLMEERTLREMIINSCHFQNSTDSHQFAMCCRILFSMASGLSVKLDASHSHHSKLFNLGAFMPGFTS